MIGCIRYINSNIIIDVVFKSVDKAWYLQFNTNKACNIFLSKINFVLKRIDVVSSVSVCFPIQFNSNIKILFNKIPLSLEKNSPWHSMLIVNNSNTDVKDIQLRFFVDFRRIKFKSHFYLFKETFTPFYVCSNCTPFPPFTKNSIFIVCPFAVIKNYSNGKIEENDRK